MNEQDLHYLAGFFDGEGTAMVRFVKARNGKRYKRLEARVTQKDPCVLYWIQSEMGFGRVQGKYDGRANECHDYVVYYAQARSFLNMIEPYLRYKQAQVQECLKADA